ncbi:ABC transporter substrate-binding protein [Pikeienuella piscinae]|uniref:ABC transporter substrate-binding protein n=1 Tax=Pikeienuella piscinae TaxID=2748098 RepID=A0A7L5BUE3_9RHOB|nr:TRAP transporter substrate-binding protein DctP [Pikeienuella piscinae]QIE53997.1 ABC transporter substrate-binding protein [Pikeienuella piscinae]
MKRRTFLSGAALAGASTALAAPAISQERRQMTIVSAYPRDFPGIGISVQRLVQRIGEISDGKIATEYYAAGERVGAFDVLDEVASGNSQAYCASEYYFTGKHPAYAYFTVVPFGMTTTEANAWIKFGGGQELWDELAGEFGIKSILCSNTGTQAGGWFNKEINSADDLKGLKMRIAGLGGQVMTKLGASTVVLPGGQIYENLVSGTIDAAEWIGPYNDYFMKFYEAAKYYYTAGMHEPNASACLGMNASWWGSLSEWEKNVIRAACLEENANSYEETQSNNGVYLKKLVDEHGVQVRDFNDDTWDAFGDAAAEVFEEVRNHSDIAARIDDSYQSYLRQIGGFMDKFEYTFVRQRNRVLGLT